MGFGIKASRIRQIVLASALFALVCSGVDSQTASKAVNHSSAQTSLDWPVYGGQAAGDHYSSLTQINRKNVQELQIAWKFDAGEEGGLETSPIVVGRVLYAYTATQKVIARRRRIRQLDLEV